MSKIIKKSDITNLVETTMRQSGILKEEHVRVRDYNQFKELSTGTKWHMDSGMFDRYSKGGVDYYREGSNKIVCMGGDCYNEKDHAISQDEVERIVGSKVRTYKLFVTDDNTPNGNVESELEVQKGPEMMKAIGEYKMKQTYSGKPIFGEHLGNIVTVVGGSEEITEIDDMGENCDDNEEIIEMDVVAESTTKLAGQASEHNIISENLKKELDSFNKIINYKY